MDRVQVGGIVAQHFSLDLGGVFIFVNHQVRKDLNYTPCFLIFCWQTNNCSTF